MAITAASDATDLSPSSTSLSGLDGCFGTLLYLTGGLERGDDHGRQQDDGANVKQGWLYRRARPERRIDPPRRCVSTAFPTAPMAARRRCSSSCTNLGCVSSPRPPSPDKRSSEQSCSSAPWTAR